MIRFYASNIDAHFKTDSQISNIFYSRPHAAPLPRKVKASVVSFRKILLSVTKNCEKDYKITNERNKQKCLYFSLLNNLT